LLRVGNDAIKDEIQVNIMDDTKLLHLNKVKVDIMGIIAEKRGQLVKYEDNVEFEIHNISAKIKYVIV